MDRGIDADVPLDYVEFQIFPRKNRYGVFVYSANVVETLASGHLEELLLHLPKVKDLHSKGTDGSFKLQRPDNLNGAEWFTKSILTRFLHIVGSPDIIKITNAIKNEISQLEETRRFHLSLYAKDHQNHFGSGEIDGTNLKSIAPSMKAEVNTASADPTKNELMRAMDLRLTALRAELADAFNQATKATCSLREIMEMEKISHHFGATDLRDSLHKYIELSQRSRSVDCQIDVKSTLMNNLMNDRVNRTEETSQILKPSYSDTPVKYGVSPAKVAQVERQSLSESGESSDSNEEDRPSAERSRTLIRSASPRRSASPMRRVQIGRSGSHRATALTIKSLNYFPARERLVSSRDAANSSEDEESEPAPKKSENNVMRMSVQDAINLFESKQRDQTVDIQKTRSLLNVTAANKSVLRRWSAGMGENSAQSIVDTASDPNNLASGEVPKSSPVVKTESELISGGHCPGQIADVDVHSDSSEKRASHPVSMQTDTLETQREESSEKLAASVEWSRQKEAELNQLLMKMMESKPKLPSARYKDATPDTRKSQNVASKQRGGFYNQYKEKRDEKLRGEISRQGGEKEAQFSVMQKMLDERKAEMASTNANDTGRRRTLSKAQKPLKKSSQLGNPKKETSKPAVVKKSSSKASSLPATRKSWPSTPSPRAAVTSPAETPVRRTSTGNTPTHRKPQAAPSVSRSSPKVERSQPRTKTVKAAQYDTNKSVKGVNDKKHLTVTKNGKPTKTKGHSTSEENSSTAKLSFYNKVTKKSSVVPLESKPFLRKGSGIGPGVGPVAKTKVPPQPEESLKNSGDLIQDEENKVVINTPDPVSQQQERVSEALEIDAYLESETQLNSPHICEDTESCSKQVSADGDDDIERVAESASKTEAEEECIISPSAWVEIEEDQDHPIPCSNSTDIVASPVKVAQMVMPTPRVRHSLSQMLLEETIEPDIIEWESMENPPAMVSQKDAPKGLKRLLKFARKSKADVNLTGWSSPSAFSEGEEDGDETKAVNKRNADNLLRKTALRAKNYGQPKNSSSEAQEYNLAAPELSGYQSNLTRFTVQSSHKLQESRTSASTTKATRSFFSLSAFRGSKP